MTFCKSDYMLISRLKNILVKKRIPPRKFYKYHVTELTYKQFLERINYYETLPLKLRSEIEYFIRRYKDVPNR